MFRRRLRLNLNIDPTPHISRTKLEYCDGNDSVWFPSYGFQDDNKIVPSENRSDETSVDEGRFCPSYSHCL